MDKKSRSRSRSGRSSQFSKIQYFGNTDAPNVVGKTRLNAISTFFNNGVDYRISYTNSGATTENNDTVASQTETDSIVTLSVYKYEAPSLVNISFAKNEAFFGAEDGTYNVDPRDGKVVGDLPSNMLNVAVGSTITLPSFGNLQRAERRILLVGGTRSIPDPLTYMPVTHWSDGTNQYLPGSQYTVGSSNVTFAPGWSTAWRATYTTGGSNLSAAPGDKIYIYSKRLGIAGSPAAGLPLYYGFSPITRIEFRGRINGTTGGTTAVTYTITDYQLINYDTLEITVPQIPTTSNYLSGGRYGVLLWIERSNSYSGVSRESRFLTLPQAECEPAPAGATQHRFITIV